MAFDIIVMCAAKCGSKGCMGTKGKQPLPLWRRLLLEPCYQLNESGEQRDPGRIDPSKIYPLRHN